MLSEQIAEIKKRIETTGIGLKDALSVIDMTFDDQVTRLEAISPDEAFTGLNTLINRTVHGTTIERFRPRKGRQPFHTLEIHTEGGEVLGYLNMMYMKRLIPCYYLVYVEVMPAFRRLGLGHRILKVFMEFVEDKKAVGLLDNIIPSGEPTYELYGRLGWKNVKDVIGNGVTNGWGNYMVFVPTSIHMDDLKNELVRILFNLKKKRPVIDMHDNEDMVKRTIEEFRSVYQALEQLFAAEIASGTSTPLMCFMFTRLATKLIGFQRRISVLIGYTGGESLDQISLSDPIRNLPIQPYSLWNLQKDDIRIWGDQEILHRLPETLKQEPTLFIEALPFYSRPYLRDWQTRLKTHPSLPLKISDLLDLGLDPTRLKEFHHEGVDYIFERISPHFFRSLVKKRRVLEEIERHLPGLRFRGAIVRVNPPSLIFRDRGNIYALRKKVEGIHSQEALDQLRTCPHLKEMNRALAIDSVLIRTMHDVMGWLSRRFSSSLPQEIEELTYFFPWNIEKNTPRIQVDASGISLDTMWIA